MILSLVTFYSRPPGQKEIRAIFQAFGLKTSVNRQQSFRPWSTWNFKVIRGFGANLQWFSFSGSGNALNRFQNHTEDKETHKQNKVLGNFY